MIKTCDSCREAFDTDFGHTCPGRYYLDNEESKVSEYKNEVLNEREKDPRRLRNICRGFAEVKGRVVLIQHRTFKYTAGIARFNFHQNIKNSVRQSQRGRSLEGHCRLCKSGKREAGRMRSPDMRIGRDYLDRWWLIPRNRLMNIYLHKFTNSDDDRALHDHPWWNLSILLKGSYREHFQGFRKIRRAGDLIFRSAKTAHRIEVLEGPVWTIFITGPKVRSWGFLCPKGWRHWREFTSPLDSGQIGRGCE
jgi:hypothetical protein